MTLNRFCIAFFLLEATMMVYSAVGGKYLFTAWHFVLALWWFNLYLIPQAASSGPKKIRFYHRWVYALYFRIWTPLYKARPHLVQAQIDWMNHWMDKQTTKGDK